MAGLMALKRETKDELVSDGENARMHVPIEIDAIDLTIRPGVLEVLGSDQYGSEVRPQRGKRAVARKHCKV